MKELSISGLCRRAGMSRQNYYAQRRQRRKRAVDAELVIQLVQRERQLQPRLGGRKVLHEIREELRTNHVAMGRDRFYDLLRANGLLLEAKPAVRPQTTQSRHSLPVFRNLVATMTLTAPNQAWASDLMYVRTDEGYLYAALITDMFSRRIVGAYLGDSLESEGCQRALEMALATLPPHMRPVHHSDRGCQYCCHDYVARLQNAGLSISMTEELHCYENALAERVNGILKQEYGLDSTFCTKEQARKAFAQAVWLYNHRRPHMSLNYRTPAEVHQSAA